MKGLTARLAFAITAAASVAAAQAQPGPAPTPTPAASPAPATTPAPAPADEFFPAEAQKPHVVFLWDFLGRYDTIEHLVFRPDIERARFEARPELDLVTSDRFRIGARAVADWGTDRNTDNDPNFDNYRSRGVSLDRYFVEGKPGPFDLKAGSFAMPLLASEMLWDHDIQTLGVAAAWETRSGDSSFAIAGFGARGPQREGDRTRVEAGQIIWRSGDPNRFAVEAAGSFWNFEPDHLKVVFIRQNYSEFGPGGVPGFISKFQIADALLRFRFPLGAAPVQLSFDGLKNFGSRGEAKGDDKAFEANVTVGTVGTPGRVRGFYTFQYVEREAVLGAYNTDDWWFHTWYRGHRFGLAVTILPETFIQGTAMYQERLDRHFFLKRYTADLVKMF